MLRQERTDVLIMANETKVLFGPTFVLTVMLSSLSDIWLEILPWKQR